MTTILNRDTDAAVELHRILTASLTRAFGLTELLATALADEIARGIRGEAGGSEIYIPTMTKVERDERNAEIRRAFRGDNHDQLAREYGLSRRQVERILSRDTTPLKMSHRR